MSALVFSPDLWRSLQAYLVRGPVEEAAILRCGHAVSPSGRHRFIVRQMELPDESDVQWRSAAGVSLAPAFVTRVAKSAAINGEVLVFAHGHPFENGAPAFSSVDSFGESHLNEYLHRRWPNTTHGAIVVSRHGCAARILSTGESVDVVVVGERLERLSGEPWPPIRERYDRQVRAFGREGQARLAATRVGIVGLGGTGSIVAQQLAYLGVREYLLFDDDAIELTNLNRVVGATMADIGRAKVVVAKDHVQRIRSDTDVSEVRGNIHENRIAALLLDCDLIFCCTDSHSSRAVMNQLAYQYAIPTIDMGTVISTQKGVVSHIAGRVQLLSQGLACLVCGEVLDPEAVRRGLQTESERALDPYIPGFVEPQPAVLSLNSTVASLAVTMFLGVVAGVPAAARHQLYDGVKGTVRVVATTADERCIVCSVRGAWARGSAWALPGRA